MDAVVVERDILDDGLMAVRRDPVDVGDDAFPSLVGVDVFRERRRIPLRRSRLLLPSRSLPRRTVASMVTLSKARSQKAILTTYSVMTRLLRRLDRVRRRGSPRPSRSRRAARWRQNGSSVGPPFGREREDFEQSEQNLEVLGLALKGLAEMRWDRKRRDAVRRDVARPGAGHISLAGGFAVLLLLLPVIVFDGQAAGFGQRVGLVADAADRSECGRWIRW